MLCVVLQVRIWGILLCGNVFLHFIDQLIISSTKDVKPIQ
jgi:hypothetical protein